MRFRNPVVKTTYLEDHHIRARARIFSHLSASFLGLLLVFSLCQFNLDNLKGILLDALYRTQWWSHPASDIRLIAYDDRSSTRYENTQKIPAEELGAILKVLLQSPPKITAVIAPINEKIYSADELNTIASSASQFNPLYIGYTDNESLGRPAPDPLREFVKYSPGFISRDTFHYGKDTVTRRVMISVNGLPTVYARIASRIHDIQGRAAFRNVEPFQVPDSLQTYIRWQGRRSVLPPISSEHVVSGSHPVSDFGGKIVIIGSALLAKRGQDHVLTPYTRMPFETSALEAAAEGLLTLIRDDGLKKTPWWVDLILCTVLMLVTVNLVLSLPPFRGILVVLLESILLLGVGGFLLFFTGVWLNLAHPLLTVLVSYYLVIPYRLVEEYRRRWHYQEKSELMSELEQLKSNFLSLVSHDLKTPVARIQGNAELLLNGDPLSSTQKERLEGIVQTTQDLSQHVETVLDLIRVEHSQIPIQKTTKDINDTILEVVRAITPLALEKRIAITTELERLFSFKFDSRLMMKVVSNLIENAIKYSAPNTQIHIASKEVEKWVQVSVSDQGIGIPKEDQENIFNKFYRSSNVAQWGIKGTGLGLYLVKYFVELHEGMITLKSELNRGSTFTVCLPV